MTPAAVPSPELVHGPLERWARERGDAVALEDGESSVRFGELYEAVRKRAAILNESAAPATVFIEDGAATLHRVIDFLGTIASGRCAAVSDPDWTEATRHAVRASLDASPAHPRAAAPTSPFYIGFTSGSTGMPKGFRRHHRSWTESFRICIDTFGPDAASRIAVPGRCSHSLFLFGMLFGLWSGAGVVLQERFSAGQLLATLREGRTPCLVAVPSQLLMVLELAKRRELPPIDGVRLVLISGARWMRERTPDLKRLFPSARIVEFYGASETSFISWMDADANAPPQVVGRPFGNVDIDIRNRGADGSGLIYVRSPMLFMDYAAGSDDSTSALRDGDWLSVRDVGRLDDEGRVHLLGRENRMIVTQGKNLFPEELESVLAAHEGIAAASVHGLRHPVRGHSVTAIVKLRPQVRVGAAELVAWCRQRVEAYKVPRELFACEDWPLTAGGKTDHRRLAQYLASAGSSPWLQRLP